VSAAVRGRVSSERRLPLPDACLGCSSCVAVCPVASSDGRFAGPKVLGPAFERLLAGPWPGEPGLGPRDAERLGAGLCLQCHLCDLACPAGVEVSSLTRRAKALARRLPRGGYRRLMDDLLADQERFGRLAAAVRWPRSLLHGTSPWLGRTVDGFAGRLVGLHPARRLPRPPRQPFRAWFEATRRPREERDRQPVILFVGCHGRFHDPVVPRAAVEVLRSAGYRVVAAQEVCCGSPALSVGDEGRARDSLEANARLLDHLSTRLGGGVPIVSPCPSCSLSLRRLLPELIGDGPARAVADAVWDLGEFLAGPARVGLEQAFDRPRHWGDDGAPPSGEEAAVTPWTYHASCHLRALGVGKLFPALLSSLEVPGRLDAGPAADGCCGMGGLTGLTREGYDLSLAAGARVLEAYRSLAAAGPVVLSDCPACRWQIAEATGLKTAHPVELLAARLRDRAGGRNSIG